MVDFITTQNFGNAQSIIVRMNNLMGFPNVPTKTDAYSIPREHASKPGEYLVVIKPVWAPKLQALDELGDPLFDEEEGNPILGRYATVEDITGELNPAERNTIKSREELEAEGAFD